MSVGPSRMASGLAGAAQSRGSEPERSQQDDSVQQRKVQSDQKAESASGVGETAKDQETAERDADGRRLWEPPTTDEANEDGEPDSADSVQSKAATGDRGANLDLSG